MNIGYARVSTRDQNLELQLDALNKAGCETIFQEKASGVTKARPELDRMLTGLRPGDTVYIYKLDRLGRSLKHLSGHGGGVGVSGRGPGLAHRCHQHHLSTGPARV